MLRAIYDFVASALYEPVFGVLAMWGLAGLVMLTFGQATTRGRKVFAWAGVVLMIGTVVFSMVFEDFLPGLQSGRTSAINGVGMALALLGTIIFAWGGYVFVRATFRRMGMAAAASPRSMRAEDAAGDTDLQRVPVPLWFAVWGPGLAWLAGGFLTIVMGASLNNENRFPLAWLWRMFGL